MLFDFDQNVWIHMCESMHNFRQSWLPIALAVYFLFGTHLWSEQLESYAFNINYIKFEHTCQYNSCLITSKILFAHPKILFSHAASCVYASIIMNKRAAKMFSAIRARKVTFHAKLCRATGPKGRKWELQRNLYSPEHLFTYNF